MDDIQSVKNQNFFTKQISNALINHIIKLKYYKGINIKFIHNLYE
jgi:hypothetical protein